MLELTVVRVGIWFSLDPSFLGMLQVIWVLGVSMIVLAGLIFLPIPVIALIGGLMVIGHNLLDQWSAFSGLGWLAIVLHQPGALRVFSSEPNLIVLYPLIPWIGVMALGFVLGGIYGWEASARRRFLVGAGMVLTIAWLVLRFTNAYGDPTPWEAYPDPAKTAISFLNAEKYPASLVFLLMTGGPILIGLGLLDGWRPGRVGRWVEAIGRAPLFFYLVQWYVVHGLAIALGILAGQDVTWQWLAPPEKYAAAPPGAGFPLVVVYVVWAVSIVILVPITARYAELRRRRGGLFRYL